MILLMLHLLLEMCEERVTFLSNAECQTVDIMAGGFQGQDIESEATQHCVALVE